MNSFKIFKFICLFFSWVFTANAPQVFTMIHLPSLNGGGGSDSLPPLFMGEIVYKLDKILIQGRFLSKTKHGTI